MSKKLIKNIIYPIIKSPPDFLIIGTQKGGTTSIARYLEQHPQIIANNTWKEVRYYDLSENYEQGWGWYLDNFPFKWQKKDLLTFDASPSYFYFPHIPKLIKQDLGEIKMIVILRNPVSRAYSAWQMYRSFANNPHEHLKNITDYRTFTEAIQQELNPELNTAKYPYDYINRGKYVEQLENYYQYFGKDSILILNFDSLKNDLDSFLKDTCNFLNIEKFSEIKIKQFKEKKHNQGKYYFEKTAQDEEMLTFLKDYYHTYNQELYDLLGYSYDW